MPRLSRGIDAGIWTSSEAGDVQFVDQRCGMRPTQRLIAFPNRRAAYVAVTTLLYGSGMSSDSG